MKNNQLSSASNAPFRRIVSVIGDGNVLKTTINRAIATRFAAMIAAHKGDAQVWLIGFDPEERSNLGTLAGVDLSERGSISDLLRMPVPNDFPPTDLVNRESAREAIAVAARSMAAMVDGVLIIQANDDLAEYFSEADRVRGLFRLSDVLSCLTGYIFIDTASGNSTPYMLSSVIAATHYAAACVPSEKSIGITKFAQEVGRDVPILAAQYGRTANPAYVGLIGSLFVGARYVNRRVVFSNRTPATYSAMAEKIIGDPNFIGFVPQRIGMQVGVSECMDIIAQKMCQKINENEA